MLVHASGRARYCSVRLAVLAAVKTWLTLVSSPASNVPSLASSFARFLVLRASPARSRYSSCKQDRADIVASGKLYRLA